MIENVHSSAAGQIPQQPIAAGPSPQTTQSIVLDAVTTLRNNPEKYRAVYDSFKSAQSDEERVKLLLDFATSERELAALYPATGGEVRQAAITTITVTTVFIIVDTAY